MKGDFSRDTFDPKKHYTSVLMQQGRVQVDADWNEQQAINRHRLETVTHDLICECGAPSANPGFRITVQGGNQLLIGEGRYYVDGILCENDADVHFTEQSDLPPLFDEETGLSEPPQVTELLSSARFGVVYLDVWHRHLTALDDPQIREIALGGPDTATRLKTVWQTKILPITDQALEVITCNSEFSEWENLIAPVTGTLMARTVPPSETDSPCLIPPTAGYQRLENQLYRVEIHQGGDPGGTPTFKWSRDNGSVVTSILEISGNQITVASLGPDDVLGFAAGQWVEILDDALELNGLPGQLVQINNLIDPAGLVITVTPTPNPLGPTNGVTPGLHPKLRRWDQVQSTPDTGVAVTTDWIELEGGIQVQFSDGTYRTGDYWLIPARTVIGEIEWPLEDDPNDPNSNPLALLPFGIEHHYCRLAIVRLFRETLTVEDCRTIFPCLTDLDPGESCCTAVVEPGENIQVAIDTLPPAGGCVCLRTGTHTITEAIRIERSNVILEGESPGTRVVGNSGPNLLVIGLAGQVVSNVIVERIEFETTADAFEGLTLSAGDRVMLVLIGNAINIIVQDCGMTVAISPNDVEPIILPPEQAIGIWVEDGTQVTLHRNQLKRLQAGIWGIDCTALTVSENRLVGRIFNLENPPFQEFPLAGEGVRINSELPGEGIDCRIVQNHIQDFGIGIFVGPNVHQCHVIGNQISRPSLVPASSVPFTAALFGDEPYLPGIATFAEACTIAENYLNLNSQFYIGIRVFGALTLIERNNLEAPPRQISRISTQLPFAIFLGQTPQTVTLLESLQLPLPFVSEGSIVRNNLISGALNGIGVAEADYVEVVENQIITTLSQGIASVAILILGCQHTTIGNNQIRGAEIGILLFFLPSTSGINNRILGNHLSDGSYGVGAASETDLQVSQNTIENMEVVGFLGSSLLQETTLSHNKIKSCGYNPPSLQSPSPFGAGILVFSVLGSLCIESCEVMDTGTSSTGKVNSEGTYWGIGVGLVNNCQISRNLVHYSDVDILPDSSSFRLKAHRAFVIIGSFLTSEFSPEIQYPLSGSAMVMDNLFAGLGHPHLVQFLRFPDFRQLGFELVNFSHNQCIHQFTQTGTVGSSTGDLPATVSLWGRSLVVMGNHVKDDAQGQREPDYRSIDLNVPQQVTLLGNITTGEIFDPGSGAKPTNFSDFNVQI